MNVLPTEIQDNPERNQAAPAYNKAVEKEINEKTKEFITNNFDDKTNIDDMNNDLLTFMNSQTQQDVVSP